MVIQLIITDEHLITYTTVNMNQIDQNMEEHKCQHKHRKEDENDGKANCEATTKKLFPWIEGHFLGEGSIPALEITGDRDQSDFDPSVLTGEHSSDKHHIR